MHFSSIVYIFAGDPRFTYRRMEGWRLQTLNLEEYR